MLLSAQTVVLFVFGGEASGPTEISDYNSGVVCFLKTSGVCCVSFSGSVH